MANEMVVLQGKAFTVELQSMLGSTNYGWCLTGLPEGIALLGTETEPAARGIGATIQRFWFGAVAETEEQRAEIEFTLIKLADLTATEQKHTVTVTVIPGNSEEFAGYSENGAADISNTAVPYGYVYGAQNTVVAYGYPCGAQDAMVKYGYPCGAQDAMVKYGYPCGAQDAMVKYGYPCGAQDAMVKYGYPCSVQNAG